MRGSCNYKNKNKNHKRSTRGEGTGFKIINTAQDWAQRCCTQSTGTKTEWAVRSRTKGKEGGKKSAVKQKNDNVHSAGDVTMARKDPHTPTVNITERRFIPNRQTKAEKERSHWNGGSKSTKVCFYMRCTATTHTGEWHAKQKMHTLVLANPKQWESRLY